MIRPVILESPFAGNFFQRWLNRRYAKKCMYDSLSRGEAPMVSHLLYTQVLDDKDMAERKYGIDAGLTWGQFAAASVVYVDRGISNGMHKGIQTALNESRQIEFRSLYGDIKVEYVDLTDETPQ